MAYKLTKIEYQQAKAQAATRRGWVEFKLSDCEFGCKVYVRKRGCIIQSRVLHNSVYGCSKTNESR